MISEVTVEKRGVSAERESVERKGELGSVGRKKLAKDMGGVAKTMVYVVRYES